MFGNLLNVCGVTDRLSKTAQNELINIVTIFLGVTVGATANAENFLSIETLSIIALGLCAFAISTFGGLITAKILNVITRRKNQSADWVGRSFGLSRWLPVFRDGRSERKPRELPVDARHGA